MKVGIEHRGFVPSSSSGLRSPSFLTPSKYDFIPLGHLSTNQLIKLLETQGFGAMNGCIQSRNVTGEDFLYIESFQDLVELDTGLLQMQMRRLLAKIQTWRSIGVKKDEFFPRCSSPLLELEQQMQLYESSSLQPIPQSNLTISNYSNTIIPSPDQQVLNREPQKKKQKVVKNGEPPPTINKYDVSMHQDANATNSPVDTETHGFSFINHPTELFTFEEFEKDNMRLSGEDYEEIQEDLASVDYGVDQMTSNDLEDMNVELIKSSLNYMQPSATNEIDHIDEAISVPSKHALDEIVNQTETTAQNNSRPLPQTIPEEVEKEKEEILPIAAVAAATPEYLEELLSRLSGTNDSRQITKLVFQLIRTDFIQRIIESTILYPENMIITALEYIHKVIDKSTHKLIIHHCDIVLLITELWRFVQRHFHDHEELVCLVLPILSMTLSKAKCKLGTKMVPDLSEMIFGNPQVDLSATKYLKAVMLLKACHQNRQVAAEVIFANIEKVIVNLSHPLNTESILMVLSLINDVLAPNGGFNKRWTMTEEQSLIVLKYTSVIWKYLQEGSIELARRREVVKIVLNTFLYLSRSYETCLVKVSDETAAVLIQNGMLSLQELDPNAAEKILLLLENWIQKSKELCKIFLTKDLMLFMERLLVLDTTKKWMDEAINILLQVFQCQYPIQVSNEQMETIMAYISQISLQKLKLLNETTILNSLEIVSLLSDHYELNSYFKQSDCVILFCETMLQLERTTNPILTTWGRVFMKCFKLLGIKERKPFFQKPQLIELICKATTQKNMFTPTLLDLYESLLKLIYIDMTLPPPADSLYVFLLKMQCNGNAPSVNKFLLQVIESDVEQVRINVEFRNVVVNLTRDNCLIRDKFVPLGKLITGMIGKFRKGRYSQFCIAIGTVMMGNLTEVVNEISENHVEAIVQVLEALLGHISGRIVVVKPPLYTFLINALKKFGGNDSIARSCIQALYGACANVQELGDVGVAILPILKPLLHNCEIQLEVLQLIECLSGKITLQSTFLSIQLWQVCFEMIPQLEFLRAKKEIRHIIRMIKNISPKLSDEENNLIQTTILKSTASVVTIWKQEHSKVENKPSK